MGRQKGTPNRRSVEAAELMEDLGVNPLVGMIEIALDTSNPPELRGRMFSELASYVYPKRKAVELGTPDGQALAINFYKEDADL